MSRTAIYVSLTPIDKHEMGEKFERVQKKHEKMQYGS